MNKQTGGPAFPLHNHGAQTLGLHVTGMTLRDYFAAKAMQSFILAACTNENAMLTVMNKLKTEVEYEDWLAYSAYDIADAMLKQRQI